MRVTLVPASEHDFSRVGDVITVGIFAIECSRPVVDNHAALMKRQRAWNTQFVGKHSELVRFPVAIGVFQNPDSVSPFAFWLQFVGIVIRFGNPQPAAFIPSHRDRFAADVWFAGEQFNMHAFGNANVFDRF